MAYKIKPDDFVASNIYGWDQLYFYRTQLFERPNGAVNKYTQYRALFRPTNWNNHINLKVLASELVKILVGF